MGWVNEEKLLKYRQNMKNKLEEMLKEHNRVAMQEPTGIGKSYMMINMCKEKEGNKIIFEPTRVLADKFETEIQGTNTKTMIYQNLLCLSNIDLENMFKGVDYLFLDEVHRIGAEQWGAQIKKIFKMFPNMKIIGLTATPVRTDKINVFTEFFDDIQTEPMDLLTAIEEHLLPQITYVTAYASISKEIESRQEAIRESKSLFSETKNEYLRVLETYRHKLDSIMNIPNILKKYIKLEKIDNKNFKVLLFVSRLNQIDEAEKESLKWFNEAFPEKKINIYKLKKARREKSSEEVKNFENNTNINEIDIMISVNKLIEGFHIKRVSSAIFLRRTCSNIVFLQQIGRTLSESEPIIFDFVENHKSVGNGLEMDFEKFKNNIKKYSSTNKDDKIDKPIIWLNDELLEVEKIFEKIGPLYSIWTKEEDDFIINNYNKISASKIAEELKTRTTMAVQARIINLKKRGLLFSKRQRSPSSPLTEKDKKFILKNYKKMTPYKIGKTIKKSSCVITTFYNQNGIKDFYRKEKRKNLTENTRKQIVKLFLEKDKSANKIAKILGISVSSVHAELKRNNLKYKRTYELSDEDKDYIRNNLNLSLSTLSNNVSQSINIVQRFLEEEKLKLSNYNEDNVYIRNDTQENKIIKLSSEIPVQEIAINLGIRMETIYAALKRKGITNYISDRRYKRFSKEEDEFIINNLDNLGIIEISKKLHRTISSIEKRLKSLNKN